MMRALAMLVLTLIGTAAIFGLILLAFGAWITSIVGIMAVACLIITGVSLLAAVIGDGLERAWRAWRGPA